MKDDYIRSVDQITVIDGDTFHCMIDLGFYVYAKMSCRLAGINCNELSQPGGPEAKAKLQELLMLGPVTVRSIRPDKFAGRFDAWVYQGILNVNDELVRQGFAVMWNGVGTRPQVPWPPVSGAAK
jgi:endonuclease YncB( thermonuclease family)